MIKKFFYYFNLLLRCRYTYKKPSKIEILLYDQGSIFNEQFKQNFKEFKIDILFTRLEEINLYVLIRSFYKLNSLNKDILFLNYLKTYCILCEPKWIITSNHFDKKFYELNQIINSNIKFGIIQRSPIFKNHIKDFFNKVLRNNEKLIVDYFFCFDDSSINILKNYLSANFVIIGSFLNNFHPIQKMRESIDILVISGFKEELISMANKQNHDTEVEQEKKLVQLLILI